MESSIYLDGQSRREREFIVDSAASMHTMHKTGLSPAELETVQVSPLPTTVITASIDTTEEASPRERFGHARHCPTSRRHSSNKIRGENSANKVSIQVNGKKVRHQFFLMLAKLYLANETVSSLSL